MDKYTLTINGRARFRQIKMSIRAGTAKMEGYEVLDYLYEHGRGTVQEIENDTRLSYNQVVEKIRVFIYEGFIEKLVGPMRLE